MFYNFVILGAGAAGITIALDIAKKNKNFSVALVEAGGMEWSEESQNIYNLQYSNLESNDLFNLRLRYFGGTTNHWGGYCRPLDEEDFLDRPEINRLGWPIEKKKIDKYLIKAIEILDCKSSLSVRNNRGISDLAVQESLGLEETEWIYSYPGIFSKKIKEINKTKNIDLFLNKTAIGISSLNDGGHIKSIDLIDTETKKNSKIEGEIFIVSMGGVESTRFLLNINRLGNYNFGNKSGNLGKGFMDHPHMTVGQYIAFKNFYYGNNRRDMRFLKTNYKYQKDKNILSTTLRIGKDYKKNNNLINEFNRFYKVKNTEINHTGYVHINSEQELRNSNMIKLTNSFDDLNLPIINLELSYSDLDLITFRTGAKLAAKFFIKTNYGRLKLENWIYDESSKVPFDEFRYYGHHMGTTRMHNNNEIGVVDQNLKVHETQNLYVASSSIFPTGGISNPTLTIVQISLYLSNLLTNNQKT